MRRGPGGRGICVSHGRRSRREPCENPPKDEPPRRTADDYAEGSAAAETTVVATVVVAARRRPGLRQQTGIFLARDALADEALDVADVALFVRSWQKDGVARRQRGPCGRYGAVVRVVRSRGSRPGAMPVTSCRAKAMSVATSTRCVPILKPWSAGLTLVEAAVGVDLGRAMPELHELAGELARAVLVRTKTRAVPAFSMRMWCRELRLCHLADV